MTPEIKDLCRELQRRHDETILALKHVMEDEYTLFGHAAAALESLSAECERLREAINSVRVPEGTSEFQADSDYRLYSRGWRDCLFNIESRIAQHKGAA